MDIHIQQLRYFMELAKCLNFTKAAMNLYIAQPALSQQIADLEKQLGVTLFKRTSRSVSLTSAGEILQKTCPEILNKVDNIHQQLLSAQAGLRGNLKIGYFHSYQPVLPGIIQSYQTLYPDVAVELFCSNQREMREALYNQDADIIFTVLHREKLDEYADFSRRDFFRQGLCLLLRKDHPFALSGGKDYSLLHDEVFAVLDDKVIPGYPTQVLRIGGEIGIPITALTVSMSVGPILIQVETGNAVSVFSSHDCERYCASYEGLTYFHLKEDCLVNCAFWNPQSSNAALPLFLDVLESTLGSAAEG